MIKFMHSFLKARAFDQCTTIFGLIVFSYSFYDIVNTFPDNNGSFLVAFVGLYLMWNGLLNINPKK
jgi:hypothetical protein